MSATISSHEGSIPAPEFPHDYDPYAAQSTPAPWEGASLEELRLMRPGQPNGYYSDDTVPGMTPGYDRENAMYDAIGVPKGPLTSLPASEAFAAGAELLRRPEGFETGWQGPTVTERARQIGRRIGASCLAVLPVKSVRPRFLS